jgi:hypothetical protein
MLQLDVSTPDENGSYSITLSFSEDNPVFGSPAIERTLQRDPETGWMQASCSPVSWKQARFLMASHCVPYPHAITKVHQASLLTARKRHLLPLLDLGVSGCMQDLQQEVDADGQPLLAQYTFLRCDLGTVRAML